MSILERRMLLLNKKDKMRRTTVFLAMPGCLGPLPCLAQSPDSNAPPLNSIAYRSGNPTLNPGDSYTLTFNVYESDTVSNQGVPGSVAGYLDFTNIDNAIIQTTSGAGFLLTNVTATAPMKDGDYSIDNVGVDTVSSSSLVYDQPDPIHVPLSVLSPQAGALLLLPATAQS